MKSMNLNHLEAFCVLSDTLSFSQAAKILHTSQPAISLKIKLLEESLGYELFIRDKKNIALSNKGQVLRDKIYQSYLNLVSVSATTTGEAPLKIGSVYEAGEKILIPALTKLNQKGQLSKFQLSLRSTDELIDRLLTGELDFILIHKVPENKSLHSVGVYEDKAILISSLKSQPKDLEHNQVLPLATYRPDDAFTTNFLKNNLTKLQLKKIEIKFSINSHRSMIKMVSELGCYAVIPQSSLGKKSALKVKVLMEDKKSYKLYLCTRSNFLSNKDNERVFESIVKEIKNR